MAENQDLKNQLDSIETKVDKHNEFVTNIYDGNISILDGEAKDVLLNDGKTVPNLAKRLSQFENEKNVALAGINESELKRLSDEVALMGASYNLTFRPMSIGIAGTSGFGIGDIDVAKEGFTRKMLGNYTDHTGSWMCFFPIAAMRIGHSDSPKYSEFGANTVELRDLTTEEKTAKLGTAYSTKADYDLGNGWFIPPCFVDGGVFIKGVWADKYKAGFDNGVLCSKKGLEPIHTHSDARYGPRVSDVLVDGASAGTDIYATVFNAVKSRGAEYAVTSNAFYSYLNLLVQCQSQNATSVNECAWIDISPKQPKGNNNYLKDVNDSSVKYSQANSLNSGKSTTGAIENFEKTTHDGSILGIADVNGSMYEIASGFTRTDVDGFLTIKKSIALKDLTPSSAFDAVNFDAINIVDVVAGNDGWIKLGNGSNAVFENTVASDRTFNGIPLATGVSASGTTQFGNDGIYRYLRNEMCPLRAGYWAGTSYAGPGAVYVGNYRTSSNDTVSVRASICEYV